MSIKPVQINVSESVLQDLRARLQTTRWPDDVAGWDYGTNSSTMRELADYWQNRYDWRQQEAELNTLHWFSTEIDGKEFRFIHERGKGPNPTPIVLLHGWPDSICRYRKLIPMLTDPASFGGNPDDSFDVIVPDLIEATSGGKVQARQQLLKQMAEKCWKLMTQALGYSRFVAAGGDGGSPMSQLLAVHHPDSIIGIHITDLGFHATMAEHNDLSEAEQQYLQTVHMTGFQEGAYAILQGTKPQTLSFSLTDSPVGLAAWIIEKFRTWSDCDGNLENSYSKDELLTNIMFYWVAGFDPRGYREEWVSPSLKPDQAVDVPTAVAQPPRDGISPAAPREFAERNLKNIQRWTSLPHGGHFVAMEDPQSMAEDIRAFVRPLRNPA